VVGGKLPRRDARWRGHRGRHLLGRQGLGVHVGRAKAVVGALCCQGIHRAHVARGIRRRRSDARRGEDFQRGDGADQCAGAFAILWHLDAGACAVALWLARTKAALSAAHCAWRGAVVSGLFRTRCRIRSGECSYADKADWIFALVRTDRAAPKHKGISFLLCDMNQPGVETRPIKSFQRTRSSARKTRVGTWPNTC